MLRVHIRDDQGIRVFEHDDDGPLVLGRAPSAEGATGVVADPRVSCNHLELHDLGNGRVSVRNLSGKNPVLVGGDQLIASTECLEVRLPAVLRVGESEIRLTSASGACSRIEFGRDARTMVQQLGDSPDAETLATWFQRVVEIQHAATGTEAFFAETARAVVELIGLDRALVLLRRAGEWEIAACEQHGDPRDQPFSRSVLDEMLETRSTQFDNPDDDAPAASLADIEAVVAAPVFDRQRAVVGAVYGSRRRSDRGLGVVHTRGGLRRDQPGASR